MRHVGKIHRLGEPPPGMQGIVMLATEERRHRLVRHGLVVVRGHRPAGADRLGGTERAAPQLLVEMTDVADEVWTAPDEKGIGFGRVGEPLVLDGEQAHRRQAVEQRLQPFRLHAEPGGELSRGKAAFAERREEIELHAGEHGKGCEHTRLAAIESR